MTMREGGPRGMVIIAGVLLVLALQMAAARAVASLLVVAPHPDDEVITAGGILYAARTAGRDVNVVVLTNGDYFGESSGLIRQGESVAALGELGIPESRVIFLGYPDSGLLALWNNAPAATQAYFAPRTARTTTYGTHGFGGADFHTVRTGAPGGYNRTTLVDDLRAVLELVRPEEIYATGAFDQHPDHRAAFYALREASASLAAADASFRPVVYTTIVHDPLRYPFDDFWPASAPRETPPERGNDDLWPNPSLGSGVPDRFDPDVAFVMPPSLPLTILAWAARRAWAVPAPMRVEPMDANLKMQSLRRYATQASPVLYAHVKADEFFWRERLGPGLFSGSIARGATATATNAAAGQPAAGAIDGVVAGAPDRPSAEWATSGPGAEAVLRLTWPRPALVDRVRLFDRVGLGDHVTAARLGFDDGGTVEVGTLANDGRGDDVFLPDIVRTSSLTLAVDAADGTPGLAEIEVFGGITAGPCDHDADCPDPGPCMQAQCVEGVCAESPVAEGVACGDADACNGVELCHAGMCVREPPPACEDGDPCTRDVCASPGSCRHEPACPLVPARGRGACRVAAAGVKTLTCRDGDPRCDGDQTTNKVCRFDLVLCLNAGVPRHRCDFARPVMAVQLPGAPSEDLASLVGALTSRLPARERICAGPAAVQVALGSHKRVRRRLQFRVTVKEGRALGARMRLVCRAAPRGAHRRPPAPLVP